MPVNPAGMAMEEVTVVSAMVAVATTAVVTAAMVTAAMVTTAMVTTAMVAATPRLCRRISRGHHQTGYAYGGETIDCKQGACCYQAGQEFACSTLSVLGHFISLWRVQLSRRKIEPLGPITAIATRPCT